MKRMPIISNYALKHATPQEIEDYYHDHDEQEHYRELAEEAAWIGGENHA